MEKVKKYGLALIILLLSIIFIGYKHIFIRSDEYPNSTENKIGNTINPVSYNIYFYTQQKQPSVFFTTPAFPSYTKWCHENKQLCSVLPIQQIYADTQWLGSIQFVGSQAETNQLLGLSKLIDNLTNLAPYWDYPYAFGQLLIPIGKFAAKGESKEIVKQSYQDAKDISDKSEIYNCDSQKLNMISNLSTDNFIKVYYDTGAKMPYYNVCKRYENAHYNAFNAFYFRRNAEESARSYKISSFTPGSPGLAPIMAALVYGRGGEHIKSASIWYDKYSSLSKIDSTDDIIVRETDESLKKAVFELQLQLITDADDASNKICNKSYECLQKGGYIKKSINDSYERICENGKVTSNLRCVLLQIGLDNKRITRGGALKYPISPIYTFSRSTDYDSRWIVQKD